MWNHTKNIALSFILGGGMAICLMGALIGTGQTGRAAGTILCVVPNEGINGPFAACNQVFASIQDAVDAAQGGEEIWIATGIYTDVHTRKGVSQIVYLDKDITLRGGFLAPFDAPPNPTAFPTTLNARHQGRGIYLVTDTVAVLDGLTVTEGRESGLSGGMSSGDGGGIYGIGANVIVRNSMIFSNSAGSEAFGRGGGMAFVNSVITLTDNIVQGNFAGFLDGGAGGGIAILDSMFYLADSDILSNTAAITAQLDSIMGYGGGLALSNSVGELRNNVIAGNVALAYGGWGSGGGIYAIYDGSPTHAALLLEGNLIRDNAALVHMSGSPQHGFGQGGGLMIYQYRGEHEALAVTMTDNKIWDNRSVITGQYGQAGGLYARNDGDRSFILTLDRNEVVGNVALQNGQGDSSEGLVGGLVTVNLVASMKENRFIQNAAVVSGTKCSAGGIYYFLSQVEQQNDVVLENSACQSGLGDGGGIFIDQSTATLTNVVIADNRAQDGAGIWMVSSDAILKHPTLARNMGSSAIYMRDPNGWEGSEFPGRPGMLTVTNAVIVSHMVGLDVRDGNTAEVDGALWHKTPSAVTQDPLAVVTLTNQFVGDPHFVEDGYHIAQDSAARGRGLAAGVAADIDGEARSFPPDLGADEYWLVSVFLPTISR